MVECAVREVELSIPLERERLRVFLEKHGLRMEWGLEYAVSVVDSTERIIGCGCAEGNILKCFAIDKELRGENLLGRLMTELMKDRFAAGHDDLLLVTKPGNETIFGACGFYTVVRTGAAVLMENRPDGVQRFLNGIPAPESSDGEIGAVVMNANPMTKGHLHLIEYAAAHCGRLYVFVVQEDRSAFPFADRLALVRKGVETLQNVTVCPSGPYMISNATFPAYFLKQEEVAGVQADMDVQLFASIIAPRLGVRVRFVGQEPVDPVTAQYNEALKRLCPQNGIRLCEIQRCTLEDRTISASVVRAELERCGGVNDTIRSMVPACTAAYLEERFGTVERRAAAAGEN